jgi:DNA polymerase-3 subunit epsilon
MVIVEKGRTVNERSAVLVENGVYKGYTFYELSDNKYRNSENILLIPMKNRDTAISFKTYKKNKGFKIINL